MSSIEEKEEDLSPVPKSSGNTESSDKTEYKTAFCIR